MCLRQVWSIDGDHTRGVPGKPELGTAVLLSLVGFVARLFGGALVYHHGFVVPFPPV